MAESNSSEFQKDLTEGSDRYEDVVSRHRPDDIAKIKQSGQRISFITRNNVELVVRIVTDEIIRLTYYLEGDLRTDFSYAIDPDFQPQEVDFSFSEENDYYLLKTRALKVIIRKKKMLVSFYDREGNVLCEDEDGFYRRERLMKGITELKITKKAPRNMYYFGLGDKAVDLHLRGRAYENWCTDSYAYERGDDPLYRSIPFYLGLMDGRAYGIFLDNSYRTRFSFDRKKNRVSSFSARGGVMDYYFIYGPELTTVSERYTRLTGTPAMPPMWALGYHQSRWSYFPESRVRKLADTFREKQIPCDAIYLDIDYMDEYRCFTWNNDLFPDAKKMIADFRKQGFKTIVMIDPGIKVDDDFFVYREGVENDYFCKRPDGELLIAPVWPPKCTFPDFTDPEVRTWWTDLHQSFMDELSIAGIWNDMNEPAVFEIKQKTFPNDIRHAYDGHPCSHKKAHNIYGMQMARASVDGIKKHAPDKRPFLLTRANFSGGQRYAALWTGDNIASWDHLKLANEQCQRLSISGFSFVGSDIGGFVEQPGPELMARWLQLGVFHPVFRNHSMGYNVDGAAAVKKDQVELQKQQKESDQEPWVFGEKFTEINRQAINLRYRLLSYLYTAFWKYTRHGTPILKPAAFINQSDSTNVSQNDAFMFGDHILVTPALNENQREVEAYLPEGNWYHFWDNGRYKGGTSHNFEAPIERIPFLVNEGTVLPLRPVMQYTDERELDSLDLRVYHSDGKTLSSIYEDEEDGWDYKKGRYQLTTFEYQYDESPGEVRLRADREGKFTPSYKTFNISLIGLPFEPDAALVDGRKIELGEQDSGDSVQLTVPSDFTELTVS